MAKQKPRGANPNFLSLPKGSSFIIRDDKTVELKDACINGARTLPTATRCALALTEACCEIGIGKVYQYIPHPKMNMGAGHEFERFDAAVELCRPPELFFTPERWTVNSQASWREMSPAERLWNIDARHGWVAENSPVLPLSITYHEPLDAPSQLTIRGPCTEKVTLILNPSVWVAAIDDLEEAFTPIPILVQATSQPRSIVWRLKSDKQAEFERWRILGGLQGIAERLEQIFRSNTTEYRQPVCLFRQVRLAAIRAAERANALGQPAAYGGRAGYFELLDDEGLDTRERRSVWKDVDEDEEDNLD